MSTTNRNEKIEHRWGPRAPAHVAVHLERAPHSGSALSGSGYIRDVSVSGAFIETDLQIPLQSAVRISFQNPSMSAGVTCSIPGFVMRQDRDGLGIEWSELASADEIQAVLDYAHYLSDGSRS